MRGIRVKRFMVQMHVHDEWGYTDWASFDTALEAWEEMVSVRRDCGPEVRLRVLSFFE